MAARDVRAGRAYVELGVNSKLAQGLKLASRQLDTFGKGVRNIGLAFAGIGEGILLPLQGAALVFDKLGSEMHDASVRTGVTVEALSALKFAAEQNSSSLEELEKGLRKMSSTIVDAAHGSKSAQQTLSALGLTFGDLIDLSPDEQMNLVADGLAKITNASVRSATAVDLFGRSGTALLPTLEGGAAGLKAFTDEAQRLGLVMSTQDAAAADEFGDSLSRIIKQAKALTFQVGAAVAQALQPFASVTSQVIASTIQWVKMNRALIIGVGFVATGILAVGAGLVTLGVAIQGVGFALGGIVKVFGAATAVIGALLGPVGLVVAAITGLGIAFGYATETGQKALAFLGDRFKELRDIATEAFGGIADALAAGDIRLAVQILWAALQLAFLKGTRELQTIWIQFKSFFLRVGNAAFFGLLESFAHVAAGLSRLWAESANAFKSIWRAAVSAVTGIFESGFQSQQKSQVDNLVATGQITREEGEKRKRFIEQQFAAQKGIRLKEEADIRGQTEQELQDKLAAIEQQRQARLKAISDAEIGASAAATGQADTEIAALEKQAADLNKQLEDSRAKAKAARALGEFFGDEKKPGFTPDDAGLGGIGDGLDKALAKLTGTAGIFNPRALQTLVGGTGNTVALRTAKATEETAKNTKRILDNPAKFT